MEEAIQVANVEHCQVTPSSSVNPFRRLGGAELKIRGKLLKLSRELLQLIIKAENQIPWPYFAYYYWTDKNSYGASCKDWQPPDDCVLLVLFLTREEDWKARDAVAGGRGAETWRDQCQAFDERFYKDLERVGMSKSNEQLFLVPHGEKERMFRVGEFVEVAGLLLVPNSDGKYRRLASTARAKWKFLSLVLQQGETTVCII